MIKEIRPIFDNTMIVRKIVPDPKPKIVKELSKEEVKEDQEVVDPFAFLNESVGLTDVKKSKRSK